jgi:hypothetical protein
LILTDLKKLLQGGLTKRRLYLYCELWQQLRRFQHRPGAIPPMSENADTTGQREDIIICIRAIDYAHGYRRSLVHVCNVGLHTHLQPKMLILRIFVIQQELIMERLIHLLPPGT